MNENPCADVPIEPLGPGELRLQKIKDRIDPKRGGAAYLFSCPPEWEQLIIRLDNDIAKIDPDYEVLQVKAKFGGLRYYIKTKFTLGTPERSKIDLLIGVAETESYNLLGDI